MVTSAKIRELAAIGRALMSHEMVELAHQLDMLQKDLDAKARRLQFMENILKASLDAADGDRSVQHILNIVRQPPSEDTHLFSYAEIARLGQKLEETQKDLEQYKTANKQLAVEGPTRSPEEILKIIEDDNITRFSFVEVRQLLNHVTKRNPWGVRKERKNIKELMDLVKQEDPRVFSLNEMRMMLRWGREQQQTASNLKIRLGRAFFDPRAWMDRATGFFLSDSAKKAMLKAGSLHSDSFQEGLFARPTYLNLPDHGLIDPDKQYHAGEHFHTNQTTGLWWCGTRFADLTSAELQKILEEALGELRALHIGYSEGTK